MTLVDQTDLSAERGDCLAACLAAVLGLPLVIVPNFCAEHKDDWLAFCQGWLHRRGYGALFFAAGVCEPLERELAASGALVIAGGETVRPGLHACVYRHGRLAHDPHPSRAGLVKVTDWLLVFPAEAADPVPEDCA